MRIMGIDLGTKRIGVAMSDETATIAQANCVIERKSDEYAASEIKRIADAEGASEIVVGLPLNMDGTSGERAEDAEHFAEVLRKETSLPVRMRDERLSTMEAKSIMLEADLSREKRKKKIDRLAAQIILQGYLDEEKEKVKDV